MHTLEPGPEASAVTVREFKARTKELKTEVQKRVEFARTALAGKRKGDYVVYDSHTRVKVTKNSGATDLVEPVGVDPNENEKKLLYEAMIKKPVKDVFETAFPCVTCDQVETEELQKRLQKLVNETRKAAGLPLDLPTKTVDVTSKRGATEVLLRMLNKTIPETVKTLRPEDMARGKVLTAIRTAIEANPANLLETTAFKALVK